jgi:hypothetical protein
MTCDRVIALHRLHPEWSSKELALVLGCSWGYVRSTLLRNRLVVPSGFARRRIIPGLREARVKP